MLQMNNGDNMLYIKEIRLITEDNGYKFVDELEKVISEFTDKRYAVEIQYSNIYKSYSAIVIARTE